MVLSAFGGLGHFRERSVNFARLLKLPFLRSYEDQILVAQGICSEFCYVIEEPVFELLLSFPFPLSYVLSCAEEGLQSFLGEVQSLLINLQLLVS